MACSICLDECSALTATLHARKNKKKKHQISHLQLQQASGVTGGRANTDILAHQCHWGEGALPFHTTQTQTARGASRCHSGAKCKSKMQPAFSASLRKSNNYIWCITVAANPTSPQCYSQV